MNTKLRVNGLQVYNCVRLLIFSKKKKIGRTEFPCSQCISMMYVWNMRIFFLVIYSMNIFDLFSFNLPINHRYFLFARQNISHKKKKRKRIVSLDLTGQLERSSRKQLSPSVFHQDNGEHIDIIITKRKENKSKLYRAFHKKTTEIGSFVHEQNIRHNKHENFVSKPLILPSCVYIVHKSTLGEGAPIIHSRVFHYIKIYKHHKILFLPSRLVRT